MNKNFSMTAWGGVVYIFVLCLACHWMLPLNDGFFWDDNVYYGLIQGRHYAEFSRFILETGLPINILFFRGLDLFVGIANHRWVSFATIFLSALLLNSLFRRYGGEFKPLSLVFVSLYLTLFPFKSTVLLCTTVYQVMLLLFLLAVYVRVRYGAHDSPVIRFFALFVFSLLSFISFNTASILVLYYFYMAFEYCCTQGFRRAAWSAQSMWSFVRRNLLVLLLPIIYWSVKNAFFPTHGLYVKYNQVSFDFGQIYFSISAFISTIFINGLFYGVVAKSQVLFFAIVFFFLVFMAFPRLLQWTCFDFPSLSLSRAGLLLWTLSFVIISALPYTLVPTAPRFQGWESRHTLLFTLSLPIFVLVVVIVYLDRIRSLSRMESMGVMFRPLIVCIALTGVVGANMIYLDYQALAIKQWSVVENLKVRPDLQRYSSFWIDDQVGDFSKNGFSWYEATHQSWYEWVAIFTRAWGREKWFGNNVDEPRASSYKGVRFTATDINPEGEECRLTLKNVTHYRKSELVLRYWFLKYFGTQAQLQQFLLSLVSIESC